MGIAAAHEALYKITPADTNVTSNYTPASNTRTDDSQPAGSQSTATGNDRTWSPSFDGKTAVSTSDTNQDNQYSWGIWKNTVLATPLFGRNCNSNRGSDQYNSIISSELSCS